MKYIRILSFCIAISPVFSSAHELLALHSSKIKTKAVEIEKQMTRDRYVVYGLTALSVSQHIYPFLVWYYKGIPHSDTNTAETVEDQRSRVEKIKAFFHHLLCTQEGWTAIAQAGVSVASSIITQHICNKFIHPDTLYWYMNSHAPFTRTLSLMKKQPQSEDSREFLHLLHNRLVRQAEAICAYQLYKYKRLDGEEKEIAQRITRAMFMLQKYWLHSIAQQLKAETIDYPALHSLLSDYEDAIKMQMNHFAIVEGETVQERYVVKRQVKSFSE